MNKTMSTKYNPQEVEQGKYQTWLEAGVFKPSQNVEAQPYSIVIPPPNVTGKLHLGHAWDVTLQDMIIRHKRMQGYDTLWLPGMDHAGIATQAKVEERLREQQITRYDLGREKFLEKVWEWKEEYASTIREQWAKLGVSVDYSRERFTLDQGLNKAVNKVFVDLYQKGFIYRGEYIINWDPAARTALSDIEVIHKDVQGAFYHIHYPVVGSEEVIEIATTRPETMLGDTAVVVHPDDERYRHLIGKTALLPLVNREIPIIADEYVEMEFGTGAMKVTPAHDPNDFELGNRHDLPRINVMNLDGTINEKGGVYNGLDRFAARKQIVCDLKEQGYLVKIEEHVHSVGHSERSGAVVEPLLSTQWFVKMKPLAQRAIDNQSSEQAVDFFPPRFNQTFITWMENVHDWVISRQLWWGHQIPAWYHKQTGEVYVGEEAPTPLEEWERDPDVLDTWFSSALWPFSTMGWPEQTEDFERYFPTDTLVTGYDIIFFWVSRMIFQSLEFTNVRPFKNVLLHGLIRAEDGRKMSKSLGNGIDPMDVIDEYGVDALRWFLANGSTPGQDVRYSTEKMAAAWNFINKIWNASRYALMNIGDLHVDEIDLSGEKTVADKWILTRLNQTIGKVNELFDKFEFGEAGRQLYSFIWDDFCDWYIEMSKETLASDDVAAQQTTRSILAYVLNAILRLLHPVMPFVTEEIWQSVPHRSQSIVVATFPTVQPDQIDEQAAQEMEFLMEFIRAVRQVRNDMNTPLSKPIELLAKVVDPHYQAIIRDNERYITRFCNPTSFTYHETVEAPENAVTTIIAGAEIYLPLEGLINVADEVERLEKEASKLLQEIERVEKKLANEKFVAKAPVAIVEAERAKGEEYKAQYEAVQERINKLSV